jgi:Leucine-rich repeat (LRR) protein
VFIDLSMNNLTTIPFKALNVVAGTLVGLNLDYNKLTQIEEKMFLKFKAMEELTLAYATGSPENRLTLGDRSFQGLVKLKKLDLSGNNRCRLMDGHVRSLPNLEILMMNCCQLDLKRIAQKKLVPFSRFPKLKSLHIATNGFVSLTVEMLEALSNLEVLNISDNLISSIPNGQLHSLKKLKELNLQGNPISTLEDKFFQELPSLKSLTLSNTQIRGLTSHFFDSLNALERLEMNSCAIQLLPDLFTSLRSLKYLSMQSCNMREIPAGAFAGLGSLEELDLSDNHINLLIPEGFSGLRSLKVLDLSHNKINFVGDVTIQHLPELKMIKLDKNDLRTVSFERRTDIAVYVILFVPYVTLFSDLWRRIQIYVSMRVRCFQSWLDIPRKDVWMCRILYQLA